MTTGTVTIKAPQDAAERAAATGLIPGRPLIPGQKRTVDLTTLTRTLQLRSAGLTPGVVVAHAVRRRLAVGAREKLQASAARQLIVDQLRTGVEALPSHLGIDVDAVLERLLRTGGVARVLATDDPQALVGQALEVLLLLPAPGDRVDRRTLVPGSPHALDEGPLPALVLAVMGVSGPRARDAWAEVGVDIDDLVGGLIVTGVHPDGWAIPDGATLTLPPKELTGIKWASPSTPDSWVFVTENPSVLSASVQGFIQTSGAGSTPPRVVCTSGTPSRTECEAIAALTAAGWRVTVRADFDTRGLQHVRSLLASAPAAKPWRMCAADYLAVTRHGSGTKVVVSETPWDPELGAQMDRVGVAAYEEDLIKLLVGDVLAGAPPVTP
ncbi:DUF2399 domain-containing protein [Arthrobacter sp. 35W]|uniref:DUF2399 domain-containing protein n=1 Tax=Arthrobacter sp. 35W TaxID=1132441 RepID=UPI0018CBAB72|nr:DUF2399 domain-containing protein [Arthrobacter sp. 35W]